MFTGTENHFLHNPPRVIVERPRGQTTTYVFLGDVPTKIQTAVRSADAAVLREFYGPSWRQKLAYGAITGGSVTGGASDLDDIEALLAEPAADRPAPSVKPSAGRSATSTVEYITATHVFPEDTFAELRDKIYVTADIPPYRQHIYWLNADRARTMYQLFADGLHTVDIRALDRPSTALMAGLPIDKTLYDARERVRVEVRDQFTILGSVLSAPTTPIYVRDLADYTTAHSQLAEIVNDTYRFDLLYYGLVIKYWPMLTRECFYDYITREAEMPLKYPDVAPRRSTLQTAYRHEADIVTRDYRNAHKALSKCSHVTTAITQMIAVMRVARTAIHVRNLFDCMRATRGVPEIHAYVDYGGKRYLLRKRHVSAPDVVFPVGSALRIGLTMAIELNDARGNPTLAPARYLFLNIRPNGHYYIRTTWNEEDELGFDAIVRVMKTATDAIIRSINDLGQQVFTSGGPLPLVSKRDIDYHGLNVCLFWKRVMLENSFRLVRALWDQYMRARITTPRNTQQHDKYEFVFRKGMHQFDTSSIDRILSATNNTILPNQYAHLSNALVKQKWEQNYGGRIVRMSHRTTDLRFEIVDVRETEFAIFHRYIIGFVYAASTDAAVRASMSQSRSYKDVKKLRKLREQDPELFNLKKHGSKKVYSTICQNQHQPLIYTQDEIRDMSVHDVKRLTEYWNFTLNKPAYYGCPNAAYPHLSFMIGVHPKHYCLPCCNKRPQDDSTSRRARLNALCVQKHIVTEADIAMDAGDISRHVMAYGKDIEPGRLSRVPSELISLLFGTLEQPIRYYLYGVDQHARALNNIGCLFAIAAAMNERPAELADRIIAAALPHFAVMLDGALTEHFRDAADLAATWTALFVTGGIVRDVQPFKQWVEFIVEAAHIAGINVLTIIDNDGTGTLALHVDGGMLADIMNSTGQAVETQHVLMLKRRNNYYPVFAADVNEFFRNGAITHRTYERDSPTCALLYSMVRWGARDDEVNVMPDYVAIERAVTAAHGAAIVKKYVGRRNQCYAVMVAVGKRKSYVPVAYSVVAADGIPSDFGPPNTVINADIVALINAHLPERYRRVNVDTLGYDDVNAKILARAPPVPDARTTRLGEALYTNHQYKLFLLEFVNLLRSERNEAVRSALKELIGKTNFKRDLTDFKRDLRKMLPPADLAIVYSQLGVFYATLDRPSLFAAIDTTAYEFDRTTMTRLRALPDRDALAAALRELVDRFAVEGVVAWKDDAGATTPFPNIYAPCDVSESAPHCDGARLIVRDSLDALTSILAADLSSSLKQRYLFDAVDTTVDWFDFVRWPTETVTAYRLE